MAWFVATTGVARADPARAKIVVIVDPEGTSLTRRLQQEVEALGFEVRLEHETEQPLAQTLSEDGVVASIALHAARPGRLNLIILDPKTHDLVRAELALEAAPRDPAAAELAATRTAELLRAVRLSVPATSRPTIRTTEHREPEVSPSKRRVAAAPGAIHVAASAGPALLVVPDWAPAVAAVTDLAVFSRAGLGLAARAVIPLTPARIESQAASIEAYCSSYRLGALFDWQLTKPLSVRWGVGGELDHLRLRGIARRPWVGTEDRSLTWGMWTSGALSVRVSPHLALLSGVSASWQVRRTAVRSAGEVVRDWGRPMFLASLSLEWRSR